MTFALDTNVLVYAEGVNGNERRDHALHLIRRIPPDRILIPAQVFGELFNVLVRKAGRSRSATREALQQWRDTYRTVETSSTILFSAMDLAVDHQLGIWDSVIIAAASHSGCRLLLSEDLQDGFMWGGVTVTNPFGQTRHQLLESVLKEEE